MLKDNWNSNKIFCLIFSYSVIILIYFLGIAYDISCGFKKLPIFGGTPVFGSIFKQNNINVKLSSAAQPPLTERVSLSTQYTYSNFGNTVQNKNSVLPTPTYIGFGQYRIPPQFKPQTELERLSANRPRRSKRHCQ
ncbi:uncharacterized protein LOC100569152 [Acyrthosiphon pisum]|uniref:Uncharacterized protein n=1 Tax=Acyrthosiphon pisum TaxID=7029 RepID=A0A8R2F8P1_ACYPI|nr:uncharacterized protein LOC100569152 [Acyrthosiphon pisum]|eukprot:XP_008183582.1 PREDICTED: uncharacterized protein LOC100569152 [Acyrthosiphon pisum]